MLRRNNGSGKKPFRGMRPRVFRGRMRTPDEETATNHDMMSCDFDTMSEVASELSYEDMTLVSSPALVTPRNSEFDEFFMEENPPLEVWLSATDELIHSKEMVKFVDSSRMLLCTAGDQVLRTALLPITFPLHVAAGATDMVIATCSTVLDIAGSMIHHQPGEPTTEQRHPIEQMIHGVFGMPHLLLGFAAKLQHEVGSAVTQVIFGGNQNNALDTQPQKEIPNYETPSGEQSSEREEKILNRLRLDYNANGKERAMEKSEFLMRVDDIGLTAPDGKHIIYIDVRSNSSFDQGLVAKGLPKLVHRGLALLANHPTVRMTKQYKRNATTEIEWKQEGHTGHILRKLAKLSTIDRLKTLQRETLVWSGKFSHPHGYSRHVPLFLARGVLHLNPRELLNLLWDNSRTSEYNNFCLGRFTTFTLDDDVLKGASKGTKAVNSETRIPFTGLSVSVSCIMHVEPLEAPDEGFVIFSRSLHSGSPGSQGNHDSQPTSKNEIFWGLNVLRRVPNHPHLTDLTSLSQVGSSLVPKFLAGKIAMMGVQEFFDNVRKMTKSINDSTVHRK